MDLESLRRQIDGIDKRIVDLLNNRASVTLKISSLKRNQGKGAYSPERERDVLSKVCQASKGPLTKGALEAIYREVMSCSLSLLKPLKVAYLGPEATFTNLAALKRFGSQVEYLPCKGISDVFLEVERDNANYGVVPVENTIEGVVSHTLDMFMDSDLKICAQIILDVSHNLLSRYPKDKIKHIYSNPQVFGQCRIWLQENMGNKVELVEVSSTTRAAQIANSEKNSACIASILASKVYRLDVVAAGIEDYPHNITRFLVIGKDEIKPTKKDKTSIMFATKDKVGALQEMLAPFKKYQINLTKIESRPSKKKVWEYYFFVDLDGHKDDVKVSKALRELESRCTFLKILGSYPI